MAEEPTDAEQGGRRARTCAALIEAAFKLVSDRGFAAVSLEDIAVEAGLTKGAIYSNFRNRSELLMAMCEAKAPTLRPRFAPGAPLRRQLRACADALTEELIVDEARARFMTEYHRYAQEDPVFGRALRARYDAMFTAMGRYFEDCPDRLKLSGHSLAVVTQALMVGLVEQWRLTPAEVTPRVIRKALDTLAGGAVSGEPSPRRSTARRARGIRPLEGRAG